MRRTDRLGTFKVPWTVCDLIVLMNTHAAALSDKESANGGQSTETDADQYFEPLEMACQTRQPRLMEIALNAIHYLVGKFTC